MNVPSRRWNSQNFWRRSGSENSHLNPGQPRQRKTIKLSSRRFVRVFLNKTRVLFVWSISGDFICRHHVEPRLKVHVPTEPSFPIPPRYIDVTKTTDTTLDVMLEKVLTIAGMLKEIVNCQICGLVSQNSHFRVKKPPDGLS